LSIFGEKIHDELPMWTIYKRPRDFPESFVVRRSVLFCGNHPQAGEVVADEQPTAVASTLEDVRARLPAGLHCLPRYAEDDPCILEVWL
jgi:hypothetical protein